MKISEILKVNTQFLKGHEPMTLVTNVSNMQELVQTARAIGAYISKGSNKRVQLVKNEGKDVHYLIQGQR